jgi:hypothetical protein
MPQCHTKLECNAGSNQQGPNDSDDDPRDLCP